MHVLWFTQHNCSNETQGLRAPAAGLAFMLLFRQSTAGFTLQPNVRAAPREMLPTIHEAVSCTGMTAEWKWYLSERVNARPDVICLKLVSAFHPQPSNKMLVLPDPGPVSSGDGSCGAVCNQASALGCMAVRSGRSLQDYFHFVAMKMQG